MYVAVRPQTRLRWISQASRGVGCRIGAQLIVHLLLRHLVAEIARSVVDELLTLAGMAHRQVYPLHSTMCQGLEGAQATGEACVAHQPDPG